LDRAPDASVASATLAAFVQGFVREKSALKKAKGVIKDPLTGGAKLLGNAVEDALFQDSGIDRKELNKATAERWRTQDVNTALAGDWEQFKVEWKAKMPMVYVLGGVILVVYLFLSVLR
jgi:hypothetical protein